MAMESNAMKVVKKSESQDKIKKTVTKKLYGKQKPLPEQPFAEAMLGDGGMRFIKAFGDVLYILPLAVMVILEMVSQGVLAGLRKGLESYEKHLKGEK